MEDELSPLQAEELERIVEIVLTSVEKDVREMARLMATRQKDQILGQAEFEVRDITHKIGARVVQATVEVRKKGGTKGRARPVPTATKRRNSKNTETKQ